MNMKGRRGEEGEKGRKKGEALKAPESRGPLRLFFTGDPFLGSHCQDPLPLWKTEAPAPGAITHPPLGSRAVLQPNHRSRKEYHMPGFPKIKMENGASGKVAWIIKALIQTLVCPRATGS